MEMSGHRHAPAALSPGKNPRTHWGRGGVQLRAVLDVFLDEKICPDRDWNSGPSNMWFSPYIDHATLAHTNK
jgi:hypothetical protein